MEKFNLRGRPLGWAITAFQGGRGTSFKGANAAMSDFLHMFASEMLCSYVHLCSSG